MVKQNSPECTATTLHLLFNVVFMPALEMDIVCCSSASCIALLSSSFILSNSSTIE